MNYHPHGRRRKNFDGQELLKIDVKNYSRLASCQSPVILKSKAHRLARYRWFGWSDILGDVRQPAECWDSVTADMSKPRKMALNAERYYENDK